MQRKDGSNAFQHLIYLFSGVKKHENKRMTNEKFMENLRNAINIELKNVSMVKFASTCDISYECLRGIVYRKTKSIDSKTLVNICSNSSVNIIEIFEVKDLDILENAFKRFFLTDGSSKFILHKI